MLLNFQLKMLLKIKQHIVIDGGKPLMRQIYDFDFLVSLNSEKNNFYGYNLLGTIASASLRFYKINEK